MKHPEEFQKIIQKEIVQLVLKHKNLLIMQDHQIIMVTNKEDNLELIVQDQ